MVGLARGVIFFVGVGLGLASPLFADELTLYFIPSPYGIDWQTPTRLVRSARRSQQISHPIGHVDVELSCHGLRGPGLLTAMTGGEMPEVTDVIFRQKIGLGLFYHTFQGRLEAPSEVWSDLQSGYRTGRLGFVTFLLNHASCQRLENYLTEYRARGYGRWYGLANRPRYGEGAGCSAFGVSFVELAGLLNRELQSAWSRFLALPWRLVGGPLTGRRVPALKILVGPTRWAGPGEPYFPLFFWDPDRMYSWVVTTWNRVASSSGEPYLPVRRGRAVGLVSDQTRTPTPQTPIWLAR